MKKWFSVFRNRADLPEMTLPLVALMLLIVLGSSVLSAKFVNFGPYGVILSVFLLLVSTTAYALIILLWRRLAAIAATPLCAIAMMWAGASLLSVAVISLGTLFLAYTVAVSALSREGRYRRMFTFSLAVIVALLLSGIAWVGLYYGTPADFVPAVHEKLADTLRDAYIRVGERVALSSLELVVVPSDAEISAAASSLLTVFPSALIMVSMILAWMCDGLFTATLKQLDAIDDFLPYTHRITLPRYYAITHIVVTMLLFFTSASENPLLYAIIRNLFLALCLPCFYVGCVKLRRNVMIRLYFLRGKRALSSFILFAAAMMMGLSNFVLIFSVAGAIITLRFHKKMRTRVLSNTKV